jgi:hypothetical protein
VYSADFRHRKEITVCSRSYPLDGSAPPGPPIAFVGANRRMHAIRAELFHEVILTRHICLGIIHRVPHAPIAALLCRLAVVRPGPDLPMAQSSARAPGRPAGGSRGAPVVARLADLARSSQGAGGAAGEREGRPDRLAGRQWGAFQVKAAVDQMLTGFDRLDTLVVNASIPRLPRIDHHNRQQCRCQCRLSSVYAMTKTAVAGW